MTIAKDGEHCCGSGSCRSTSQQCTVADDCKALDSLDDCKLLDSRECILANLCRVARVVSIGHFPTRHPEFVEISSRLSDTNES